MNAAPQPATPTSTAEKPTTALQVAFAYTLLTMTPRRILRRGSRQLSQRFPTARPTIPQQ